MPAQASGFVGGSGIQSAPKGDQSFIQKTDASPVVVVTQPNVAPGTSSGTKTGQAIQYVNPLKAYEFKGSAKTGGLQPSNRAQLTVAPGQALPLGTVRRSGGTNKNK